MNSRLTFDSVSIVRYLFLSMCLIGLAACDPLVATEEPISMGAPIDVATQKTLTGDYIMTAGSEEGIATLNWRGASGVVRLKLVEEIGGPVVYDVSARLSRIPGKTGSSGHPLYLASLVPGQSLAHKSGKDKHSLGLPYNRFAVAIISVVEIDAASETVSVWPIMAANDSPFVRGANAVSAPLYEGENEPVTLVMRPAAMKAKVLEYASNITSAETSFTLSREPIPSAACIPDMVMYSQAYSDNDAARARLAFWYANSISECPQNCDHAVNWIAGESLGGNKEARAQLSKWRRSNTCSINDGNNPILRDHLKRAKAGEARAMYNLGVMYEIDTGILPVNYRESIKWYLAAAAAGHTESQFKAGKMYQYGVAEPGKSPYVVRNAATARYWYDKAISGGHPEAAAARGAIGSGSTNRDVRAEDWLAAAGALAITYCVLNPDDCFGTNKAAPPAGASASSAGSCQSRIDADLMRCRSYVDFPSCTSAGCNDYWECNRVSRYIKNDKVRYHRKRYDIRSVGKCSRPYFTSSLDKWLYCDPQTGKSADNYERMIQKACR